MRGCLAVLVALLGLSGEAVALCSSTSLAEDYAGSDLDVRARISAEISAWSDTPDEAYKAAWGDGAPVSKVTLSVSEVFKGQTAAPILFQSLDSGRFQIDGAQDYLLFLHAYPDDPAIPTEQRGTFYVRFTCGPSARWEAVSDEVRSEIARLASGK